ncbi:hypothetical protein Tco_0992748 [Tanacetum coccineum]|uniref:Uncharacterized protein n=1 Tax=Tanacetum coccineum TaxID=301880 RepID=A0ABQ5F436_9ASTR
MVSMEKQLKFLNEIVYKRNQSIQTIYMLAPKGPTFNGRPTFANPMYLKKAQYEKPCLYEIPYDQSDPANRLVPDRDETLTLEKESREKLNKDLVKPYDYTKLNSLYEIFKPPTQEYQIQLAHANEVGKKMWRKSFVKTKPNIFKNIDFLHVSKSISKSRQAYNVMTNNINHFRELVDQVWVKHSKDHLNLRTPTAHDMEILIKTCLMPLALKTQNDSFAFVHELKQEMHADLKYVESLEKEVDELRTEKKSTSGKTTNLLRIHLNFPQLPRHRLWPPKLVCRKNFDQKPVTPHSWPQVRKSSFAKPYDVNAPGPFKNSPKHVSFQSPKESVGSNDMVHNYYLEDAKKKAQLQKDKALNTKPSVQQSARLPNTANGYKPKPRNSNQQPRNWPPSMSSRVNSRALAQKKDEKSNKTTKRYIPVEKKSESRNHGRQIPIGQRFTPNKSSNVYLKTTTPRSGLTWKPTGRIFTHVGLQWIPIRKSIKGRDRYTTQNRSAHQLGKETYLS